MIKIDIFSGFLGVTAKGERVAIFKDGNWAF